MMNIGLYICELAAKGFAAVLVYSGTNALVNKPLPGIYFGAAVFVILIVHSWNRDEIVYELAPEGES